MNGDLPNNWHNAVVPDLWHPNIKIILVSLSKYLSKKYLSMSSLFDEIYFQ
jgi:hypothetical protein